VTAQDALLRARVAQHIQTIRPAIDVAEYAEVAVRAIRAVQRDDGDAVLSLPTGQVKRAREVVEMLGLTSIALDA
jgi:cytidylate kinase